jgi:hypothetical protein
MEEAPTSARKRKNRADSQGETTDPTRRVKGRGDGRGDVLPDPDIDEVLVHERGNSVPPDGATDITSPRQRGSSVTCDPTECYGTDSGKTVTSPSPGASRPAIARRPKTGVAMSPPRQRASSHGASVSGAPFSRNVPSVGVRPPGTATVAAASAAVEPVAPVGIVEVDTACPCCSDYMLEPVTLPCGHSMCHDCCDNLLSYRFAPVACLTCGGPLPCVTPSINVVLRDQILERDNNWMPAARAFLQEHKNSGNVMDPLSIESIKKSADAMDNGIFLRLFPFIAVIAVMAAVSMTWATKELPVTRLSEWSADDVATWAGTYDGRQILPLLNSSQVSQMR